MGLAEEAVGQRDPAPALTLQDKSADLGASAIPAPSRAFDLNGETKIVRTNPKRPIIRSDSLTALIRIRFSIQTGIRGRPMPQPGGRSAKRTLRAAPLGRPRP
jgi:hypothetical protein